MTLAPAPCRTGIVFRRSDLPGSPHVARRCSTTWSTPGCAPSLGDLDDPTLRIGTVEHIMAALAGPRRAQRARDRCRRAGSADPRRVRGRLRVPDRLRRDRRAGRGGRRRSRCCAGAGASRAAAFAELRPGVLGGARHGHVHRLRRAAAIGRQALSLRLDTGERSATNWPRARTFTLASEVARLREAGLALGRQPGQRRGGGRGAGAEPGRAAQGGRVRPPQAAGRGGRPGAGRARRCGPLRRPLQRPRA